MKRTLLLLLAVLAAACAKQSLQATYDKQAANIESFVSAQMNKDPKATLVKNEGVYRLTLHDTLDTRLHRPDSLQWGGKVSLLYGCFTLTSASLSSGNLVATNSEALARQAGWNLTDTSRYKLDTLTLDSSLLPGLASGLAGVQPLDEGYILFTGKYGYGNAEKGTIPARSALAFYFLIENIYNED